MPVIPFDRSELDGSIVARFSRVTAAFPNQVAVAGNGQRWTYAELNSRTNQIARAILERATRGTGCVAYLVGHSPDMVVCALAILKAGKAYLCIHPGLPAAAMRDVCADAIPDLILCDAAHAPAAREIAGGTRRVLVLDEIDAGSSAADLESTLTPEQPAVIFYTSGSTGRPKGVVKSHRAVLHRAWLASQYDLVRPGDRHSLLTYCGFASSEADVFGALLNGAAVHLFDVASLGLTDFGAWIDDERITLLHPPVVLFRRYLASLAGVNQHASVRLVALAGEAVVASDVRAWRRHFSPTCALRHRFSSTEAGHVAVACVEPGDDTNGALPAARAVSDKHLFAVDEEGRPIDDGRPGELVVRSAFLADGYWRRESATAAAFTSDPNHPGERAFRTGDLGRVNADGNFEFLGRRDGQVKVRGYRVELREVEQALLTQPGVVEAAVIAESLADEARLVGFVVMTAGATYRVDAMREGLRSLLPDWKTPTQICALAALPLTLTGKIDRQALKDHVAAEREKTPAQLSTGTFDPLEAQLAAIWEEVLGRTGIKPDDDFFDLGGHSLSAAQVMHKVKRRIGASLPLSVLQEARTVRHLAGVLRRRNADAGESPESDDVIVALREGGRRTPLFCIPAAGGSALTYQPLARLMSDDQPVYALRFPETDSAGNGLPSVEQIAAGFVEQIRQRWPHGPYRLCGHSYGAVLAFEMAQQFRAAGERVDLLAMLDGRVPGAQRLLPMHRRLLMHLGRFASRGPREAAAYVVDRLRARRPKPAGQSRNDVAPAGDVPVGDAASVSIQNMTEASRRTFRAYRPRPYPGTITLFRAAAQPDWARFNAPQPLNGWDAFCGHVEVHPSPGDHLTMLREPNLAVLAGMLNVCLARDARA